jgi:hypothetical protein
MRLITVITRSGFGSSVVITRVLRSFIHTRAGMIGCNMKNRCHSPHHSALNPRRLVRFDRVCLTGTGDPMPSVVGPCGELVSRMIVAAVLLAGPFAGLGFDAPAALATEPAATASSPTTPAASRGDRMGKAVNDGQALPANGPSARESDPPADGKATPNVPPPADPQGDRPPLRARLNLRWANKQIGADRFQLQELNGRIRITKTAVENGVPKTTVIEAKDVADLEKNHPDWIPAYRALADREGQPIRPVAAEDAPKAPRLRGPALGPAPAPLPQVPMAVNSPTFQSFPRKIRATLQGQVIQIVDYPFGKISMTVRPRGTPATEAATLEFNNWTALQSEKPDWAPMYQALTGMR